MTAVGGYNIWTKNDDVIRQFTVAEPDEDMAIAGLRMLHPDITIASRHTVDRDLVRRLAMPRGGVSEWIPLDPKELLTRIGGVPIDIPMPG